MPVTALMFDKGDPQCREMSIEERVWLADAIDTDGNISVGVVNHCITLGISNTELAPLTYAREITGVGRIGEVFWSVGTISRVLGILEQIMPYLIIKRELAASAISYLKTRLPKGIACFDEEDKANWKRVVSLRRSNVKPEKADYIKLTGPVAKLSIPERKELAAAIEFDGYISMSGFRLQLGVTNTNSEFLNYVGELTNIGTVSGTHWGVYNQEDIYEVLVQLIPFLTFKQELARAVVNYLEFRLPRKWQRITKEDYKLWKAVEANRRGRGG